MSRQGRPKILILSLALSAAAEGQSRSRPRMRRDLPAQPQFNNSGGSPYYQGSPPRDLPPPPRSSPQYAPRYAPQYAPHYAPPPVAPSLAPPLRNRNSRGQPAELPPHMRKSNQFSDVDNWYGSTGAAFGFESISKSNPGAAECIDSCKKTIEEPRWALQLQGAAGWGPVKRNNVSFTTHYRYTQNFRTNEEQSGRLGTWFKTFKASDFIFPTRDMLRSHELTAEVRYSLTPWQFGLHGILDFERVGSSSRFLGEANEVADSVRNSEQIVPWVQWRIPGQYIATLYSPMRTEINKEDPRNSFTTWSLKRAGRGIFFSLLQDNLFYLPKISSTAGVTLNWTNKKSASIQSDSSKFGIKTSFDFPTTLNIRLQPTLKYDRENYILPRIKIDSVSDSAAQLVTRADSIWGTGLLTYLDFTKNWRFHFLISYESTQSTLSDFSSSKMLYVGGFNYSWPLSRAVLRRLDRFSDSLTAEEN